jgi:hypothetical protein
VPRLFFKRADNQLTKKYEYITDVYNFSGRGLVYLGISCSKTADTLKYNSDNRGRLGGDSLVTWSGVSKFKNFIIN